MKPKFCQKCHAEYKKGDEFCGKCGNPLNKVSSNNKSRRKDLIIFCIILLIFGSVHVSRKVASKAEKEDFMRKILYAADEGRFSEVADNTLGMPHESSVDKEARLESSVFENMRLKHGENMEFVKILDLKTLSIEGPVKNLDSEYADYEFGFGARDEKWTIEYEAELEFTSKEDPGQKDTRTQSVMCWVSDISDQVRRNWLHLNCYGIFY